MKLENAKIQFKNSLSQWITYAELSATMYNLGKLTSSVQHTMKTARQNVRVVIGEAIYGVTSGNDGNAPALFEYGVTK